MIPMVDLKAQYAGLKSVLDEKLLHLLAQGHFVLGPEVKTFEKEAAHYLGVEYAYGLASGTDALILALRALGIGPGDEVITTPFTFIASASSVCLVGATPVFVDIDPDTYNLDLNKIERAITPNTKAIIPVHLYGHPVNMSTLMTIAQAHNIPIIEDCAQSFGATWHHQQTGSFGAIGCFSFYPSKNLGCYGDGGLIVTNDPDLAAQITMLRDHGSRVRYHHESIGYNSRLDEIQAAILRVKLPHIDQYNAERQRVATTYTHLLKKLPVQTPIEQSAAKHVYHQYTILSEKRDIIANALKAADIASAIYYPIPLHRQAVFAERFKDKTLIHAEKVAQTCLSLPIYPEMTAEQIEQICHVIRNVL